MAGKLRLAAESIHAAVEADGAGAVTKSFGRRAAGEHAAVPHIKWIPIGGPIARARRTAEKIVPGPAGKITPGASASLAQQGVDVRVSEAAERQPRLLVICIAGDGSDEGNDIDAAEALLERVIVAVYQTYGATDVTLESERWIVQEDERAGLQVAGEAVALTLAFQFPVVRLSKPVIRIGGQSETCKLNDTFT